MHFRILLFLILLSHQISSQEFNRIEKLIGLGDLQQNNGVAVADYDLDNDLDIFVVAINKDNDGDEKTQSKLFRNNNDGTFTDVTIESNITDLFPESIPINESSGLAGFKYGASWGDYNNDGYPDIFLTCAGRMFLFKNNKNNTFSNVTKEAKIGDFKTNCIYASATWFDVNNDSYLDIYISEWNNCDPANPFFINNGDGTFTNSSEQYGEKASKSSFLAFPFDFNNDNFCDLLVSQDFETKNSLFINNNGTKFTDEAELYNILSKNDNYMGIAIGDYNNDQAFDFYITNIQANDFLENNGANIFKNIAQEKETKNTGWSWDVTFSDFDLDRDEDLFVVSGFKNASPKAQRNFYYQNNNGNFKDLTEELSIDEVAISVGCTPFDYDNDGDLDLIVTNGDSNCYFYENNTLGTNKESDLSWLKISLEGTISNRDAIGTTLTLETNKGTMVRYHTGIGFLSQSLKPVHFGLGDATQINKLIIKWPSGLTEDFSTNLEPNTHIKITESTSIQTLDISPSIKKEGCTNTSSCNFDSTALVDNGTCIFLENGIIKGPKDSEFLKEVNYSYETNTKNTSLKWSIIGGEILNGQGTKNVTVKWNVSEEASISIIEEDSMCSSLEVVFQVTLKKSTPQSIARLWNETLLEAIRLDLARPTVHARNLFHTSIAMYDSWAIYNPDAKTYLTGNTVNGFKSNLNNFPFSTSDLNEKISKTISYSCYRVLSHRFENSPNTEKTKELFDFVMSSLGYDINDKTMNYSDGNPIALGNAIAKTIIDYGLQDGSNESKGYKSNNYTPINMPLILNTEEKNTLTNPNRWQPLTFDVFIDQSGNTSEGNTPDFVGPEWGRVKPFALTNKELKTRNGVSYTLYNDPNEPPYIEDDNDNDDINAYKWGFSLVALWSSHLDPNDGVEWDISPKSQGNLDIKSFPTNFEAYKLFYKRLEGGTQSKGRNLNPKTKLPYKEQLVPRGDFTRVLAEFWADGPDSETPPGHWFTILNTINDNNLLIKKFEGKGEILNNLEWDIKSYFLLGGAMHDAAVSTWSIKGWYDYIRPISAIRYMASLGQCSDLSLPNYNKNGIPLEKQYIEIITSDDPLAGDNGENIGEIKVFAWKNSKNPSKNVDWILAENWFPYQRPSFVTPPFAGYISGHSTFSRAAAEVLTLITGDEFFPGGIGEFKAKKNNFLVFEEGPSTDITLQWATYRDAANQSGLSRIWGGIHPPIDDIPGRISGEKIGIDAFNFGKKYFFNDNNNDNSITELNNFEIYPNPAIDKINISGVKDVKSLKFYDLKGSEILLKTINSSEKVIEISLNNIQSGLYLVKTDDGNFSKFIKL